MTATDHTDRDPLRTMQQVAPLLPDLPWLTLLDAVEECMQLEDDEPCLAAMREAIVVARLRAGRGLLAA